MENERLKIFDDHGNEIGIATREEVHRLGHWHETFHCWFTSDEDGKVYIYFQLRSATKKDYPNLLDISAAGHLLAHEAVEDGIREVKEEVGIDVSMNDLVPLGIVEYCMTKENFIDKELAHVFLYQRNHAINGFELQKEEVSGIVKAEFDSFYDLCMGEKEDIRVEGFKINEEGTRVVINQNVDKSKFVPHETSFYQSVVTAIRKHL